MATSVDVTYNPRTHALYVTATAVATVAGSTLERRISGAASAWRKDHGVLLVRRTKRPLHVEFKSSGRQTLTAYYSVTGGSNGNSAQA